MAKAREKADQTIEAERSRASKAQTEAEALKKEVETLQAEMESLSKSKQASEGEAKDQDVAIESLKSELAKARQEHQENDQGLRRDHPNIGGP